MKASKILAINPGTREMGVAVVSEGELLYYGVKTITNRRTTEEVCSEAERIIQSLASIHRPDAIALLRPLVIQPSGERLVVVVRRIKQWAGRERMALYEYAPKTTRQFICGAKGATKRNAAHVLAARFPELTRYIEGRTELQAMYYAKMFDAVAAGLTCYLTAGRSTN